MRNRIHRSCLALFLATGLFTSTLPASGGVIAPLITVDWSNPFAVVFTSTSEFVVNNDSTTFASNGVSLANFFTLATSGSAQPISDTPSLRPVQGGTNFISWAVDTYGSGTARTVNFFNPNSALTQVFSSGNTGFSGTAIVDLSGYLGNLPGFSSTGFIYAGNSSAPGTGTTLGYWQVIAVPEPATGALLAIGGMLFAIGHVRRNRR